MAAAQVYVKELERRKYGRPLYEPECEVHVGDVGFFQRESGNFRRLFNIFVDAHHPSQPRRGVPPGFELLPPELLEFNTRANYFPPQALISKSVTTKDIDVHVSPYALTRDIHLIFLTTLLQTWRGSCRRRIDIPMLQFIGRCSPPTC
jgi:hypothetical protein